MSECFRKILKDAEEEIRSALVNYPTMASPHEGWAIIHEEMCELWEEVRKKPENRSAEKMAGEAKQIAAMAIRFIYDLCQ